MNKWHLPGLILGAFASLALIACGTASADEMPPDAQEPVFSGLICESAFFGEPCDDKEMTAFNKWGPNIASFVDTDLGVFAPDNGAFLLEDTLGWAFGLCMLLDEHQDDFTVAEQQWFAGMYQAVSYDTVEYTPLFDATVSQLCWFGYLRQFDWHGAPDAEQGTTGNPLPIPATLPEETVWVPDEEPVSSDPVDTISAPIQPYGQPAIRHACHDIAYIDRVVDYDGADSITQDSVCEPELQNLFYEIVSSNVNAFNEFLFVGAGEEDFSASYPMGLLDVELAWQGFTACVAADHEDSFENWTAIVRQYFPEGQEDDWLNRVWSKARRVLCPTVAAPALGDADPETGEVPEDQVFSILVTRDGDVSVGCDELFDLSGFPGAGCDESRQTVFFEISSVDPYILDAFVHGEGSEPDIFSWTNYNIYATAWMGVEACAAVWTDTGFGQFEQSMIGFDPAMDGEFIQMVWDKAQAWVCAAFGAE